MRELFKQGLRVIKPVVLERISAIVDVTIALHDLLDRDGKLTRALGLVAAKPFLSFLSSVAMKDNAEVRGASKAIGIECTFLVNNPKTGAGQNWLTNIGVRFHNGARAELHWKHLKALFAQHIGDLTDGDLKPPAAPTPQVVPQVVPQVAPQSAPIADLTRRQAAAGEEAGVAVRRVRRVVITREPFVLGSAGTGSWLVAWVMSRGVLGVFVFVVVKAQG